MLMSALINGYEVEKTPEERLRDYFDTQRMKYLASVDGERTEYLSKYLAIKQTLEILGITIEGINDKKPAK